MELRNRTTSAALGVAVAILLGLIGAASASATTGAEPPPDDDADRVIYIDRPAPRPSDDAPTTYERSTAGTEVRVTVGQEFPLIPEPGETVRIVYTDAITEVSTDDLSVNASCTKSLTVDTPRKTSYPSASVTAQAMISSGCSTSSRVTLGLYDGWLMLSSSSWNVLNNGSGFGGSTSKTCASAAGTPYTGIASWSSGGSVTGPKKTLACRY